MWLINTSSLRLKYFIEASDIKYAILSHTWGDEEITFQDMARIEAGDTRLMKCSGFRKIEKSCKLAKKHRLDWCWIDTCCIDKNSSAELSEAINSMFAWYKGSAVCYVYLYDFEPPYLVEGYHNNVNVEFLPKFENTFSACRWLTRGWTLQELIAPRHVKFYNQNWQHIGDKGSKSFNLLLSKMTKIDPEILNNSGLLSRLPAARKMSWAASRKTSRLEDIAYCLMGIFDVNMPLLYGEGQKAFQRLQEQIFAQTNDLSLFAWGARDDMTSEMHIFGTRFFASDPEVFTDCYTLKHDSTRRRLNNHCRIDNNSIEVDILTSKKGWGNQTHLLLDLNCALINKIADKPLWLGLRLWGPGDELKSYCRRKLEATNSRSNWYTGASIQAARISKNPLEFTIGATYLVQSFYVKFENIHPKFGELSIKEGLPAANWSSIKPGALEQMRFESWIGRSFISILPFTFRFHTTAVAAELALVVVPEWVEGSYNTTCGIFHMDLDAEGFSTGIVETAHRKPRTAASSPLQDTDYKAVELDICEDIMDKLFLEYGNAWGAITVSKIPQTAILNNPLSMRTHRFYISSQKVGDRGGLFGGSTETQFVVGYQCCSDRTMSGI